MSRGLGSRQRQLLQLLEAKQEIVLADALPGILPEQYAGEYRAIARAAKSLVARGWAEMHGTGIRTRLRRPQMSQDTYEPDRTRRVHTSQYAEAANWRGLIRNVILHALSELLATDPIKAVDAWMFFTGPDIGLWLEAAGVEAPDPGRLFSSPAVRAAVT